MALEINDSNFQEIVLDSDKPVMVDFWAEWCGPCRMVGPIIDEISNDYSGKAIVGKLDVDIIRNLQLNMVFEIYQQYLFLIKENWLIVRLEFLLSKPMLKL